MEERLEVLGHLAVALLIGAFAAFVVGATNGGLPAPINLFADFDWSGVAALAFGAFAAIVTFKGLRRGY
jgi:hypothetical protein